jgi:DNA-directed RNA polymerase subunit RPC12/RpoP
MGKMKKYYCQDCGKEITRYGERCRHCAHLLVHFSQREIGKRSKTLKGRKFSKKTLEKMRKAKVDYIPWNKGLKNVQKSYWTGKSNKDVIAKHHIDGNKKNNDNSNFLEIKQGEHRSLHWRGYEYLVSLGLIKDYLSEFITKNRIKSDKRNCKVIHHIDCNRSHNDESNLLYLKDKKIHNKLHQHAYLYLVRINKIHDYIDCFFLWKKGNTQKVKAKEELK